jgi:Protein of unknown function (DUF4199)
METLDKQTLSNPETPKAKAALEYGIILAMIGIVSMLLPVIFKFDMNSWLYRIFSWVLTIGTLTWAIKSFRDKKNDGYLRIGQGVGLSSLIGIWSGLVLAIFVYLLYTVISPELLDTIMNQAYENMQKQNLTDEQIEQSMSMVGWMFKPGFFAVMAFLGTILFDVILGLIISAILKKD